MPSLRNSKAHGSSMLVGDCLNHISVCADFVNQLFPATQTRNKSSKEDAHNTRACSCGVNTQRQSILSTNKQV